MVAPQPPLSGGASAKDDDSGQPRRARAAPPPAARLCRGRGRGAAARARARGTRARTPRRPTGTSRGAKAWRSSSPVMGTSNGSSVSSAPLMRGRRPRAGARRTRAGTRCRRAPGAAKHLADRVPRGAVGQAHHHRPRRDVRRAASARSAIQRPLQPAHEDLSRGSTRGRTAPRRRPRRSGPPPAAFLDGASRSSRLRRREVELDVVLLARAAWTASCAWSTAFSGVAGNAAPASRAIGQARAPRGSTTAASPPRRRRLRLRLVVEDGASQRSTVAQVHALAALVVQHLVALDAPPGSSGTRGCAK